MLDGTFGHDILLSNIVSLEREDDEKNGLNGLNIVQTETGFIHDRSQNCCLIHHYLETIGHDSYKDFLLSLVTSLVRTTLRTLHGIQDRGRASSRVKPFSLYSVIALFYTVVLVYPCNKFALVMRIVSPIHVTYGYPE
jgi:hypothetical protein